MKITNIKTEKAEKIFYYGAPIATYILALMGGLWWLNDQYFWGGLIFLGALCVFGYEVGYKQYYKPIPIYFYLAFLAPCVLGVALFGIGFFV